MIFAFIIFWLFVGLVFHSYVLYPALLTLWVKGKSFNYNSDFNLPNVVILMAVYNAGEIIEEKIKSILNGNYPAGKITIWVGSDHSTDNTNEELINLRDRFKAIKLIFQEERVGKVRVINDLYSNAMKDVSVDSTIFISTDVTAIFDKDCIANLVKHFSDQSVAAVGANIIKKNVRADGISGQERAYYNRELLMKYEEGLIWGSSIGVFGACYAIRPTDFTPPPSNFLVDDFFITMNILSKGRKVLYDPDANVYMNLANESLTEYKRKVRIAAGNFQNLSRFWKVLFRFDSLAFSFLSHKVLRWFGPFFILGCLVSSFLLMQTNKFYEYIFILQVILIVFPFFNLVFEKLNFHQRYIKFIAHFYLMNLGVLVGFFKFLGGIKSSVWEPTRR